VPGPVEVVADGAALRVEAIAEDGLEDRDGRLVIPAAGVHLDDETVQSRRDGDQR